MNRLDLKNKKAMIAELIIILFGILLALGLDEWNSERTIARDLEAEQERLEEEISHNYYELVQLCAVIASRLESLETIGVRLDQGASFALDSEFFGFPFPELVDAVWQRLSRDERSSRMDPDYIEAVYTLYYANDLQVDLVRSISDFVFSPTYSDPGEAQIAYSISKRLLAQQANLTANSLLAYQELLSDRAPAIEPAPATCRP
jgi:hypothetical protein